MRRLNALRFAAVRLVTVVPVVALLWPTAPNSTRAQQPAEQPAPETETEPTTEVPGSRPAGEAQNPPGQLGYKDLIRRALQEFKLGHWTEARVFFAEAHALRPNARTLRGLGLVSYEARSYVEAIDYFEQALASKAQPLTQSMRVECSRLLGQARQFVSNATVEVDPPNADLLLDGRPLVLGEDASVLLDPGQHEFVARAEGFEPLTETVLVHDAEMLRVKLQLQRIVPNAQLATAPNTPFVQVPAQESASASPEATRPSTSSASSIAPWIVIGASSAVIVTGSVFLGVAASNKSTAENPGPDATWPEVDRATKRGRTFFPVGFVLLGTGLAGLAAGCLWKLWPTLTERQVGAANIRLTPGGITVSGTL